MFYVAATGEIIELWWRGNDVPQAENVTKQAGAPPVAVLNNSMTAPPVATTTSHPKPPSTSSSPTQARNPWEIWWRGPGPKTPENLDKLAGAPETYIADPFTAWSPPTGASM